MVKHFKDGTFVYPGALFRLTPEELTAAAEQRHGRSGWVNPVTGDDGEDDAGAEDEAGFDNDDNDLSEREVA
jgi:hypothetical protein